MTIYDRVSDFTMTSQARVDALCREVRRVCKFGVPGAIVECGVWRGGSAMAAALALAEMGADREIVLCDTFSGMPPPGQHDRDLNDRSASDLLHDPLVKAECGLDEVRRNIESTGYPRVRYVAGLVENTLPAAAPAEIAILRLDTDWYESTRHCLECLWPRVSVGGALIVDDYGHWKGARMAVDEYFGSEMPLERIDYTGILMRNMPLDP